MKSAVVMNTTQPHAVKGWGCMVYRFFAMCAVLLVALLAGGLACTRKESAPSGGVRTGGAPVSGALTVRVITTSPTAQTDLQAVCDNCPMDAKVRYRWERNGQTIAGEEGSTLVARGAFLLGDAIKVTVFADGRTGTASVVIGKTPPTVTAVVFKPDIIHRGVDITAVPAGKDADGEAVQFNYRWILNGVELPEDTAVLGGHRFRKGDTVSLVVTPYGTGGAGNPLTTRTIVVPNAPPRITSLPPSEFKGEEYSYQVSAEDPDDDPVFYSLISGPMGMSLSSAGLLSVRITREIVGTHQVEIEVKDAQGASNHQAYTLNLAIP